MGDKKRINDSIKYGMIYTLIIMAIGLAGLQIFAEPLINIFSVSPQTHTLCIRAIRIITIGYLFVGANIAYQGIFQALGFGVHSLILSLIRLIIIALPLAWLFTKLDNADTLVWAAFPIAECVAFFAAIIMMKMINKKLGNTKMA